MKDKRVIMIGERHYMEANYIIQAELLMFLHKNYRVKNLLIEYGRAEAFLYNQYLKTGKIEYLEKTSPGISNHYQFFQNWQKLFDYNSRLKEGDKILVHGIDFEREPSLSFVIKELLHDYSNHLDIQFIRESLGERLDTIGMRRETKSHMLYLKKVLGDISFTDSLNAYYIDYILENNSYKSNLHDRDRLMLETFLKIDSCQETFLGQLGRAHTMLNAVTGFSYLLNERPEYRNQILVTNMFKADFNTNKPLYKIINCPVALCGFNGSTVYGRLGPWAIILKDQPYYPPIKYTN
jgi:hypothetical protein